MGLARDRQRGGGVDSDRPNAKFARGASDAGRDFAPIRDQERFDDHRRFAHRGPTLSATWRAIATSTSLRPAKISRAISTVGAETNALRWGASVTM
jgi:hypothetical protein